MTTATEDQEAEKLEGDVAPKAPAGSAPAGKDGEPGGKVDATDDGSDAGSKPGKDGAVETITRLRADRRNLRSENDALKKKVDELMAISTKESPRARTKSDDSPDEGESPSFFEDPKRHLDERDKRLQSTIVSEMLKISEKQEALNLILSQDGFTQEDQEALADLMHENGLDLLAEAQPMKAAKLAIKLYQQEKGLTSKAPSKARAASIRGGAPASSEGSIRTSHIRDLQRRISKGEDVRKELAEAWQAAQKGRIIED